MKCNSLPKGILLLNAIKNLPLLFALLVFLSYFKGNAQTSFWNQDCSCFDLKKWNSDDDIIQLDGEVDFYWEQKLTHKNNRIKPSGRVKFPGFWSLQKDSLLRENPYGLATFQFQIKLPDTTNQYAIKIRSITSAYEIWANGSLISQTGVVSSQKQESQPDFQPVLVDLPKKEDVDVSFVISNYHHRKGGGSWEPIYFGKRENLEKLVLDSFTYELIASIAILIIALYHIMLFAFYNKEKSYLIFSLLALSEFLMIVIRGEMIIQQLFPDFPYALDQQLRYLSFYFVAGFATLYAYQIYPTSSMSIPYICMGSTLLFGIVTLLVPLHVSTYFPPIFQLLAVPIGLYYIYIIVINRKKHKVETFMFLLGGITLLGTLLYAIFVSFHIIRSGYPHVFGFLIHILSQTILLAYRHRKVYGEKERLQTNLQYKEQDMITLVSSNKLRHEITLQINQQLELIYKSNENNIRQKIKELINNLKLQNLTFEKVSFLQENIQELNAELDHKLKERFPELSVSEREICQLILLKLRHKEIAHIRNTSTGAIKTACHRIKKKMMLAPGENLFSVIRDL